MVDGGDWRAELDRWLEPFLAELNHAARRTMCPHYVAALTGLGERKSMQPMAAHQDGLSYDRLQHFISVGRWDDAPLVRALQAEADRMVGERDAVLVIDDTSLPKKGRHPVGIYPRGGVRYRDAEQRFFRLAGAVAIVKGLRFLATL